MSERFVFFKNFKSIADKLPDDMRLKFYDAMTAYAFEAKEPDDVVIAALITAIKPSLDKEETRGGNHNPTGQNQYSDVKNGQSRSKEVKKDFEQVKNGQSGQSFQESKKIEDKKFKEKDIPDGISKKKEPPNTKYHEQFEDFWLMYIPVKGSNGKMVAKGSKSEAEKKFIRILEDGENYENIRNGLQKYLEFCRRNDQITCGVTVFLNQKRWLDGYDSLSVGAENTGRKRQEPVSLLNTYVELADQYRSGKPVL